jgi:hypothetical protein
MPVMPSNSSTNFLLSSSGAKGDCCPLGVTRVIPHSTPPAGQRANGIVEIAVVADGHGGAAVGDEHRRFDAVGRNSLDISSFGLRIRTREAAIWVQGHPVSALAPEFRESFAGVDIQTACPPWKKTRPCASTTIPELGWAAARGASQALSGQDGGDRC